MGTEQQIVWFKASYSEGGTACVETSTSLLPTGVVPVRDSKDPALPHLTFGVGAFAAFIGNVKDSADR